MDSVAESAAAYTLTGHRDPHQWDPYQEDQLDHVVHFDLPDFNFTDSWVSHMRAPLDSMIFYNFGQHGHVGATGVSLGPEMEPEVVPVPNWALWACTVILTLTITIGIPLNGATILIFLKCKKLRHLVNFVLLLDCISHLVLMFTALPVQLIGVWNHLPFNTPSRAHAWKISTSAEVNQALVLLQQLTTNFVNLTGVLFIFTIAILRYRRLCWKKKDRLSIISGLKWALANGGVAMGFTAVQGWAFYRCTMAGGDQQVEPVVSTSRWQYNVYLVKISLISILTVAAVFCYIRVSQRIWTKTTSHEQGIDMIKQKKSRTVHLRATIHSCIQIILVLVTILPHLYEETVTIAKRSGAIEVEHQVELTTLATGGTSPPPLPPSLRFTLHEQDDLSKSMDTAVPKMSATSTPEAPAAAQVVHTPEQDAAQLLTRLLALTVNYSLLILGTPTAYIASCHRFREQFARILCSHHLHFGLQYLFPISTSQSPYHQHGRRRRSSGGSRRRSRSSIVRRGSNCPMTNGHCTGNNGDVHAFTHVHLHESPITPHQSRRGYGQKANGHTKSNGYASNGHGPRRSSDFVSTTGTPSYYLDQYSSSTSGNSRRSSSLRGARRSISNTAGGTNPPAHSVALAPQIVIEAETPSVTPIVGGKKRKLARGISLPDRGRAHRFEERRGSNGGGALAFESIHIIEDPHSNAISSFVRVVNVPLRLHSESDTMSTATNNSNSNSHSSLDPVSGISNNCSSVYQLL